MVCRLQELADARDSPIFLFAAAAASSNDATDFFPAAAQAAMQIRGLQLGGQDGQQLQQGRSFRKDQFAEILGTRHHQRSGLHEVLLRRLSLEEFGNNLPVTSLPNEELYQLLSTIQAPAASLESPSNFHPLRRVMFTALRSQALRARVVAALVQLQKLAGEAQLEAGRVQLSCSTVSFQIA